MAETETPKEELLEVHISAIRVEEHFNVRDFTTKANKEHVAALATSMRDQGQLDPVVFAPPILEGDKTIYPLLSGESRFRAMLFNVEKKFVARKDAYIKGFVRVEPGDEQERLVRSYLDNTGKPFELLEMSELVARLSEQGLTQSLIGRKIGVSHTYVGQLEALHSATDKTKAFIRTGRVAPSAVIETMQALKDPEKVEEAIVASVSEAVAAGSERARSSSVATQARKRKLKLDTSNVRISASQARQIATALGEAWNLTSKRAYGENPVAALNKIRRLAANVLEDATGLDANVWAKSIEEEAEEDAA